jgi:hypothetical protein
MTSNNNLIFIEGKYNQLFVYIYLSDFRVKKAIAVLNLYTSIYEKENFKKINIFFWNKYAPGDFLSMFRRKINKKCTRFLLKGASYIEASFDYLTNIRTLNNPVTVR